MQTRIVYENQMPPELDRAVCDALALCYPHAKDKFQGRHFQGLQCLYTSILLDGDIPCGYAAVVDRTIRVGATPCRTAGIANVYVLPEYRGKALSTPVLETAMAEAKEQGFDFGLLFTSCEIEKVYLQCGWKDITAPQVRETPDSDPLDTFPEARRLYYPLNRTEFPPGNILLNGPKW